jgi:surface protein
LPEIVGKEMDVVEMVLMERATGIPLDLIILIRSFVYEKLTDDNFFAAVRLWFGDEEKCRLKFGHISDWNTSRVTNMERAFSERAWFDEDLSQWNVSSVKNMSYMFVGASRFNGALSQWNVANVTDMSCMFTRASEFNEDLSRWNVSRVTNMSYMFKGAAQFNGDISQWDVRNVQNLMQMFYEASHFDRDLSRWDIGRREMWSTFQMFVGSPQSIERYIGTGRKFLKAL